MKELSIEEKAKRYDVAFERAKEMIKAMTNIGGVAKVDDIQYLFPELKESEDERIRGAIIDHLKDNNLTEWAAWLEKQGEHDNFRNNIQIGDKVTRNEDGVLVNLSQLNRVAKKQGEQKPADKVEPKFKVGDVIRTLQEAADGIKDGLPVIVSIDNEYYRCNNEIIAIKDQDNYEYPPINRKHNAWSEDDEAMLYGCIETEQYMLDVVYGRKEFNVGCESIKEECQKELDWLKSLKERVQPKQEWSEGDEKIKESIITGLEMLKDGVSDQSLIALYNKKIDWLKSLRLQKLSIIERTGKNWEEPVSEDLEEVIEQLAENARKHKAETSSPFFSQTDYRQGVIDGAQWQKQHLWKPADGDDLPEYDREVIAILDYDFGHYKVVYAHRPNPNGWNGTNIDTGEKEYFEPATYGKGGWNQPHILYWLDARLPYEEK